MRDKQSPTRQGIKKEGEQTPKKKKFALVEKISLFAMMIIGTYIVGSELVFRIMTKTGEWYNYTILIVLAILSVIVDLALVKEFLALFFVYRQKKGS